MRYLALATDYDGTLARDGVVDQPTMESLKKLRDSGRKLILVTGRRLTDLQATFSGEGYFDRIVAENGAVLYDPETKQEKTLCEPYNDALLQALVRVEVQPLEIGHVILATWNSQKEKVLDAIQREGVECQIIFNKGSLMILPAGVNKATGFLAALEELGLSAHNTVGVGDAENDHAFLSVTEAAVAVANALPALQERADLVTAGARGEGVRELIDRLLADDLQGLPIARHVIRLGEHEGSEINVPAYGTSLMVAGTSGGGKSTLTTGFLERLREAGYQFCAVDPEGDYQSFPGAVVLGDTNRAASAAEIVAVLENPRQSVVVSLLGVELEQRPQFFQSLLPQLVQLRACTGRPHWIVVDEAHHILPSSFAEGNLALPKKFTSFLLITMEPEHVDPAVVSAVDRIIAVGESPQETIRKFAGVCGVEHPELGSKLLEKGQALQWSRGEGKPMLFQVAASSMVTTRHSRKYATAELTPDRSFYFRGPDGKLNLRAQNLMLFLQIMDGVDDETWLFHFRAGEYSRWFREAIKSDGLAEAAVEIERHPDLSAEESRKRIREQIEERYTLPG